MKTIVPHFLKKDFYLHTSGHFKKALLKKLWKKRFWGYLMFFLLSLYLIILANAKDIETYSTFPGMKYFWRNDTEKLLKFEKIQFVESGKVIQGIFADTKSQKTIYYFHGNGGPLPFFYDDILYLQSIGYNVAALEYSGFNETPGMPYEESLFDASNMFFDYLKETKGLSEENTIVWGYSIGSGIATNWAKYRDIEALVLVSPLASRYAETEHMFGFALQKLFFLQNTFQTQKNVESILAPTLVLHGNIDPVIPYTQGKDVWKHASSPQKYFIEIDGATHNGILDPHDVYLKNFIQNFLRDKKLDYRYIYYDEAEKVAQKVKSTAPNIDIESDFSITKYIDPYVPFTSIQYIPEGLTSLRGEYISQIKPTYLRKDTLDALNAMSKAFYEKFGKKIVVVSGYRSYEYQTGIKMHGCPDSLCAHPGHSEHQSGLAVDLFEASTQKDFLSSEQYVAYFEWLKANAHIYGFTNSYQKGPQVDGYAVEPWHWRYVGVDFATYLKENSLTFGEFYKNIKKK